MLRRYLPHRHRRVDRNVTPDDAIFLAIKPRYALKILSGTKSVELRRSRPRDLREGSLVVLYASSPVKAVLGTAEVARVVTTTPADLWPLVSSVAGVTRDEFDTYFDGAAEATGIFVRTPEPTTDPYGLDEIRRDWPGFSPPQAFRYLRSMGEWAVTLLSKVTTRERFSAPPNPQTVGASDQSR